MTIIVVEGPDGAGKSTLIDNLRLVTDRHYVTLRRNGPPKDVHEISTVVNWVSKMTIGNVPLILDRHPFISEGIYGSILRGKSLLSDLYTYKDVENHFRESVDRVIYCRPPTSVIHEKIHANPQLKGVVEKLGEIVQRYDSLMKMLRHWGIFVLDYDWTEHSETALPIDSMFFGRI